MIKTVFLDVDNTLIDFNASAYESMKQAFRYFGLPYDSNTFPTFLRINNQLWQLIEEGKLSKEEHSKIRWNTILKELRIEFDGIVLEEKFVEGLNNIAIEMEGATELVSYLTQKYTVCLTSNAPYNQQMNRLKLCGLDMYPNAIYISEKIGYRKPNKAFFEFCLQDQKVKANETIVIGDSLHADIFGAKSCDIKTIWLNPEHNLPTLEIKPDFTVESLFDIFEIL